MTRDSARESVAASLPGALIPAVAFALAAFHFYTGGAGQLPDLMQRAIHVGGCLALAFLTYPLLTSRPGGRQPLPAAGLDIVLGIAGLFVAVYVVVRYDAMTSIGYYASDLDLFVGGVLVLLVVEAARRVVGLFLPMLSLLLFLYALFSDAIPGRFGFAGFSLNRVLEVLFATPRGVWGDVTGISATIIAVFVLFGSVLFACGGGKAFMDVAILIGGRTTGGAAKVAVVASGLFGSLSGSAAANIATTGTFTIPMMTRLGYNRPFASAVEAVASSGGQLLPPIMGAGAFIMAELLGISYGSVALGALLPALLFYAAVFFSVHFESARLGYRRIPDADIPQWRVVLAPAQLAPLLLPLALLVGLLLQGYTPTFAGFWATAAAIGLFAVTRLWQTRGDPHALRPLVAAFVTAGKGVVTVGVLIACAQIIVALIGATGIGVKLSALIVLTGEGQLWLSLLLAMCLSIVLGMGLPTTAAYLLAATVVAPALAQLGISGLAAHLFIFYYAILAGLTPPVCGAVFIAAAIAGTPWTGTLTYTFRLALPAFVIPFLFIEHDVLLLHAFGWEAALRLIQAVIAVIGLGIVLVGNCLGNLSLPQRAIMAAGIVLLFLPHDPAAFSGAVLVLAVPGLRLARALLQRRFQDRGAGLRGKINPTIKSREECP